MVKQKVIVDMDRPSNNKPGEYISMGSESSEEAFKILEKSSLGVWLGLHQCSPKFKGYVLSPAYFDQHYGISKTSYYRAIRDLQVTGFLEEIEEKHFIFHSYFNDKEKARQKEIGIINFKKIYPSLINNSDRMRLKKSFSQIVDKEEVEKIIKELKDCSTSSDTTSLESSSSSPSVPPLYKSKEVGTEESNGVRKGISNNLVEKINKQEWSF